MATIKKVFATVAVLVETANYGGSAVVVAADGEYDYTSDVDLETNGYEGSHVTIEWMGSNTKDDLVVDVFASLDATTYDTEPFASYVFPNRIARQQASIVVKDVAHFRLGVKSSGTNTTFEYQISHQAWNRDNS